MSDRKRINISVDPATYEALKRMKEVYEFNNLCEIITALVHILLDRVGNNQKQKQFDIPEDDGAYIDRMFEDLGHVERTPDGNPPRRHNRRGYGKG